MKPAQETLKTSEQKEVKDYWELTSLLTILASCYGNDPATAPQAIPLLKRAAAVNLRCGEPYAYIRRLQKLAKIYAVCGMQQDEVRTYEETYTKAAKLYGSRSPALGLLCRDMAIAQLKFGDKEAAESNLNKAIAIFEVAGSKTQMKDALLKLADVVRQLGRVKEADELQSRATSIKEVSSEI